MDLEENLAESLLFKILLRTKMHAISENLETHRIDDQVRKEHLSILFDNDFAL